MDIRLEVSEKLKGLTGVSFSPEDGVYEFIEIPQLVARTEYGIFTLYGGYGLIFGNRIGGSQDGRTAIYDDVYIIAEHTKLYPCFNEKVEIINDRTAVCSVPIVNKDSKGLGSSVAAAVVVRRGRSAYLVVNFYSPLQKKVVSYAHPLGSARRYSRFGNISITGLLQESTLYFVCISSHFCLLLVSDPDLSSVAVIDLVDEYISQFGSLASDLQIKCADPKGQCLLLHDGYDPYFLDFATKGLMTRINFFHAQSAKWADSEQVANLASNLIPIYENNKLHMRIVGGLCGTQQLGDRFFVCRADVPIDDIFEQYRTAKIPKSILQLPGLTGRNFIKLVNFECSYPTYHDAVFDLTYVKDANGGMLKYVGYLSSLSDVGMQIRFLFPTVAAIRFTHFAGQERFLYIGQGGLKLLGDIFGQISMGSDSAGCQKAYAYQIFRPTATYLVVPRQFL